MDTILTIHNEELGRLSPKQAVEIFRDLLWSEAYRLGIPLSQINISSQVNVSDGGVDASVDTNGREVTSAILQTGINCFQIKTGLSFAPWQNAMIRTELFGGGEVDRENLGSQVRACMDSGGIYILVCFGLDLIDEQQKNSREHLQAYFQQCGYANPRIDVWSQNQLLSFFQSFPALALRLNGRNQARFELHQDWASHDDMRKDFKSSPSREQVISTVQRELRRGDIPRSYSRLWRAWGWQDQIGLRSNRR